MADYHVRFMNLPGPTDVLSFPMDELRPPADGEEPPEGLLGDIVLCPSVTERQAADSGRTPEAEADYSCTGCCICSATTTRSPPSTRRCSP